MKKRTLSVFIVLAMLLCLFTGLTGTAGAAGASPDLAFFSQNGYGYSMLGSNWTSAQPLTCAVGETPANLRGGYDGVSSTTYRYMSACTNKTVSDMSMLDITVYYGSTYSASGDGYTSAVIPKSTASGTVGHIAFTKTNISGDYGSYYDFEFYPDTTAPGNYYYYVVINDGSNTLSSVSSQAFVKVGRVYGWASVSGGVMTAKYLASGTGSLDSGNYYLKFQAKNASGTGLYFFTAAYAKEAIPASGSAELSGAAKLELSLVKASDGSVVDTITVS